jgi:hypothetical protein
VRGGGSHTPTQSYPLLFGLSSHRSGGGLGDPVEYTGPDTLPQVYVIDPDALYPVRLSTTAANMADPSMTARATETSPGNFAVTPSFNVTWKNPRFYSDWEIREDGNAHLTEVLVGAE